MDVRASARFIVLACLFTIPFIVLYVSNSLFFPFITGKGFAFRILVEIALAAYVVLALAEPKYRPKFSWTLMFYGGLTAWMIIANAFAVSPFKAFWSNFERMDGWITLVHAFTFFVIAGAVLSVEGLWRKWWLTFLSASALVSLYGVFQLWGVFQIHQGGVRLDATLGNAAYLAAYLLFAIGVALWQALESKGWVRYILSALAGLHIIILFFTATRGAILGAVGAAVLGSLLWMVEAGKTARRTAGVVLAGFLLLIGAFLVVRDSAWVAEEPTLARLASISLADGETRFTIWSMALDGFLARPVTGWGQEGFNYVFNTYYQPSLYAQEPWFDRAHNVYLDWLTAGGAPALLLFLALLASAIVAFYRGNVTRTERIMLTSVVAAYAFQALFVFDNLFTYVPIAALFALAHSASMRPFPWLEHKPALTPAAVSTVVTPIVVVVGVVVLWVVNVPNIAAGNKILLALSPQPDQSVNLTYFKEATAERSFGEQEIAEQLVSYAAAVSGSSLPDESKAPIISYAVERINEQIRARPQDARILLQATMAYRAAGDLSNALKMTEAALTLSPNKQQILIELGTTYWQLGRAVDAHAAYQKAHELAPAYDDGVTYAAAGNIVIGKYLVAQQMLQNHFGTTTVPSDILVFAYYDQKLYRDIVPLLEARLQSDGTIDAAFRLASAYGLVGRYADARALVSATIAANPSAAAAGQQLLKQLGG